MNRVVDRRMVMGDREKRVFRDMLGRVAAFCGVGCLTHCVMGNHFHLLVEVRDGERDELIASARAGAADEEIFQRVEALYGRDREAILRKCLAGYRAAGKDEDAWRLLEPLVARMSDLAVFVKELKFRFSAWFNGENGRVGTLWESRFRSVLVEGTPQALAATAAYIDLNPVRAGLVRDPKDYRFCGYAEAVGGRQSAREGLSKVVGHGDATVNAAEVLSRYRLLLFGRGQQRRDADGLVVRRGFSSDEVEAVEKVGGKLALHVLLRSRVRYLTEGAAIGSDAFLSRLMESRRELFGAGRKRAGRPMRGGLWGELCAVRDLRS